MRAKRVRQLRKQLLAIYRLAFPRRMDMPTKSLFRKVKRNYNRTKKFQIKLGDAR